MTADTRGVSREALLPSLQNALYFAGEQALRIIQTYPNYVPMYTVGGRWNREGERWTQWCEGFFPGILWLLHKHTGDTECAGGRNNTLGLSSRAAMIAPCMIWAFCSSPRTTAGTD